MYNNKLQLRIFNKFYRKMVELDFSLGCGELNQWVKARNEAYRSLTDNKNFKTAQKRKLVTYDKETRNFILVEEKNKELGCGSYNHRLKRKAQGVSDPEIKKLLLQAVVGKPKGVTIDKIYGKHSVKIEAIAPLGGTVFTIGLKCESGGEKN